MAQVNSQSLIPAPTQGPESPETVSAVPLITPSKKKVAKKVEACAELKSVVAAFNLRTANGEVLSSEEEMLLESAIKIIAHQEKIDAAAAAAEKAQAEADAKAKADKIAAAKESKGRTDFQKKVDQNNEKLETLVTASDALVVASEESLEKEKQIHAELSSQRFVYDETLTLEENEARFQLTRKTIVELTNQGLHCHELTTKLAAKNVSGLRFQPPKAPGAKPAVSTDATAAVAPALVEESITVSSSGSSASSIPDETAPMNVDLPPITESLGDVEVKTSEEEVVQPWAESDHEDVSGVESAVVEEASAESATGKRKASQGKGKSSRARRGAK